MLDKRKLLVLGMVVKAVETAGYDGVSEEQIMHYTVQVGKTANVTEKEALECLQSTPTDYLGLLKG